MNIIKMWILLGHNVVMVTLLMLFPLLQCGEKGHYANMVSQLINIKTENETNINLLRFQIDCP